MKKILIIEDDENIKKELAEILKNYNYQPINLTNFKTPIEEIKKIEPDLILLDIQLPYLNGELLLEQIRACSSIPVIMVTSKNTEIDEVLSMAKGADDYITKPYNPSILLLRIAAVLKRSNQKEEEPAYKDLEINLEKGLIKRKEIEIILTKNETIIFSYLLHHQNRVVTRDELMTDLWNNDEYINDNALTVNISRLRKKLKEIGYENAIETRKKVGYILS